jgi:hypothetical protein
MGAWLSILSPFLKNHFKKPADIAPIYPHHYKTNQYKYACDKLHQLFFSNLLPSGNCKKLHLLIGGNG